MKEKRRKKLKRRVRGNSRHPDLVRQGLRLEAIVDTRESPFRDKISEFFKEYPEAKNWGIGKVGKEVIPTHYKTLRGFTKVILVQYQYMQDNEFAVYVPSYEY